MNQHGWSEKNEGAVRGNFEKQYEDRNNPIPGGIKSQMMEFKTKDLGCPRKDESTFYGFRTQEIPTKQQTLETLITEETAGFIIFANQRLFELS